MTPMQTQGLLVHVQPASGMRDSQVAYFAYFLVLVRFVSSDSHTLAQVSQHG